MCSREAVRPNPAPDVLLSRCPEILELLNFITVLNATFPKIIGKGQFEAMDMYVLCVLLHQTNAARMLFTILLIVAPDKAAGLQQDKACVAWQDS